MAIALKKIECAALGCALRVPGRSHQGVNYINNVQPGPIDSEKTTANGEFAEILKKLMALPRYGTTIEIVEMVAHLADPTLVHHGCDPHH
jgi:NAD(P)-dependent dehydrogenase (short-subunit alcohol dehydrogenase family)